MFVCLLAGLRRQRARQVDLLLLKRRLWWLDALLLIVQWLRLLLWKVQLLLLELRTRRMWCEREWHCGGVRMRMRRRPEQKRVGRGRE